jgi:hypothetical protein
VERLNQHPENRSSELRDRLRLILDSLHQVRNVSWAFGHHEPEFGQMAAQRIDDLGALLH